MSGTVKQHAVEALSEVAAIAARAAARLDRDGMWPGELTQAAHRILEAMKDVREENPHAD